MDRRALLQWMVATGGIAAVNRLSARDLAEVGEGAHRRTQAGIPPTTRLAPDELRNIAAAAECIIPRTDTPGATDAGVAPFIEVMLADWYPADEANRFRAGLATLDATSQARASKAFADLSQVQQMELLQPLDDEVTALRRTAGASANGHWFAMLKYLTVWGYCTSEPAMRELFKSIPRPMTYDGAAPVR